MEYKTNNSGRTKVTNLMLNINSIEMLVKQHHSPSGGYCISESAPHYGVITHHFYTLTSLT